MDDDTDDKDDTKRRSRNLSEKKRRDQFNMLINELSSMVSTNNRKMDKSTVLKSTIAFLESHNELAVRSRAHEIQEDWKPSFLSNEEFTHLILEAVDGFIISFSTRGQIIYVSGSITSLLGHLPSELMKPSVTLFDIIYEEDQATLYNILSNSSNSPSGSNTGKENQMEFSCHIRRGVMDNRDEPVYELVHFVGYFRSDANNIEVDNIVSSTNRYTGEGDSMLVFVGTGRLDTPQLIREMTISDGFKSEFTSRHNLDWKFLALDSRATPIIGYVQLEVVGTSGYDYYHIDDLDKIVVCHEVLMEKGEGTSCFYRFLTKGQQWVWLQTRFYISYHQWNSKPEFIVCTHRVVSYTDVMNQLRKGHSDDNLTDLETSEVPVKRKSTNTDQVVSSPWSSKSSVGKSSQLPQIEVASPGSVSKSFSRSYQGPGSDSASMSADSPGSKHSQLTTLSARTQRNQGASARQSLPLTKPPSLSPAQASTTFIEPQHQYAVAAIPLQPLISFPGTTVVTSIPTQELLCHSQSHLSDHVKRKQHELNQLRQLMYRKEEELQQCLMAQGRCSVMPSLINVTVPYTVSGSCSSHQSNADLYVTPHSLVASPLTVTTMSPSDIRLHAANSSSESGMHTDQRSQSDSELMPFQFSQQQAQLLFTNITSPRSN